MNFKTRITACFVAILAMITFSAPAWAVRTNITVQDAAKWRDGLGASEDLLTWTAADVANMNQADFTPGVIILTRNVHASSPYTYTVTSKADSLGRSGDLGPQTLAAGTVRFLQLDGVEGFRQDDGKFYFQASDANIQFAIVRPRQ